MDRLESESSNLRRLRRLISGAGRIDGPRICTITQKRPNKAPGANADALDSPPRECANPLSTAQTNTDMRFPVRTNPFGRADGAACARHHNVARRALYLLDIIINSDTGAKFHEILSIRLRTHTHEKREKCGQLNYDAFALVAPTGDGMPKNGRRSASEVRCAPQSTRRGPSKIENLCFGCILHSRENYGRR